MQLGLHRWAGAPKLALVRLDRPGLGKPVGCFLACHPNRPNRIQLKGLERKDSLLRLCFGQCEMAVQATLVYNPPVFKINKESPAEKRGGLGEHLGTIA